MAIKKRLGEMLVEAGIIDEAQLSNALRHQRQWGGRLGGILVELKLASEEAIVDALALKFGFEIARLDRIEPYAFEQARALVPLDYAVRNRIFPISADTGVLTVAMADPTNLALTDELAFKTGRRVKVCIAGDNAINAALRSHFGADVSVEREAIPLDDDDTAMEAVYDPIGATSSEQLSHIYEQPTAAPVPAPARPARPAAVPQAAAPAARPAARAAQPAAAPARTIAASRPAAPAARPAQTPAPTAAPAADPARARTRQPAVLQLEDQPTGSLPLEELQPEELQPEELAAAPGEEAPALQYGEDPVATAPAAYDAQPPAEPWSEPTGAEAYGADPYTQGAEPYPEQGAEAYGEQGAEAHAEQGADGAAAGAPQRDLTEQEVEILAALDRMAHGDDATPTVVRPAQLLAALIRLMMQKGWITEHELLDELLRG